MEQAFTTYADVKQLRAELMKARETMSNAVKLLAAMDNILPVAVRVRVRDEDLADLVEKKKAIGTFDDCWVDIRDPMDYPTAVTAEVCRLVRQKGCVGREVDLGIDGVYLIEITPIVTKSTLLQKKEGSG